MFFFSNALFFYISQDCAGVTFSNCMNSAGSTLAETFGFALIALDDDRYVLANNILHTITDSGGFSVLKISENEKHRQGILLSILSLIFMMDGVVTERQLWSFLSRLGVLQEEHHPVFGDCKRLILNEFVRQGWLAATVIPVSYS